MRQPCLLVLSLLFVIACGEVLPPDPEPDPCVDVCECKVDTECGVHEVCIDETTSRTCGCAAGYTASSSGECMWSGVVSDPGFQSPNAWTTTPGGATVDVNLNDAGMIDPGGARFREQGLCGLARITQALQMPRLSRAEPLVVQISYRYRDAMALGTIAPAFGIGPVWQESLLASFMQFRTERVCLGADQYAPESSTGRGAEQPLVIMPERLGFGQCTSDTSLDVDRFEIIPANPGECPEVGRAINGDAEAEGGWALTGSSGTSFALEAGIGEGSTRAVRMFSRNRCASVSATTRISFASAGTPQALAFFNKTSSALPNVTTYAGIAGVSLPRIAATGAPITQKVCVPATMRGGAFEFLAGMSLDGLCADVVNAESIIDNVRVLEEPSCGTDPAISDPGFESPLALLGSFAESGKSFVRSLQDPAAAHSGNGVLQLSVMQLCSQARWEASVVVPAPQGNAGPALRFFYRARPLTNSRFVISASGGQFTPTLDDQWNEGTICLNPKFAGRGQQVTFSLNTSGSCSVVFPAEVAFVDDLQATTSASCPAM